MAGRTPFECCACTGWGVSWGGGRGAVEARRACHALLHHFFPLPTTRTLREAYCTTGFSPVLTFDVEDLQHTLTKLLSLGGRMDGKVHHSVHGKVRGGGMVPADGVRGEGGVVPGGPAAGSPALADRASPCRCVPGGFHLRAGRSHDQPRGGGRRVIGSFGQASCRRGKGQGAGALAPCPSRACPGPDSPWPQAGPGVHPVPFQPHAMNFI